MIGNVAPPGALEKAWITSHTRLEFTVAQYIVRCQGTVDTAKKKPQLTSPAPKADGGHP